MHPTVAEVCLDRLSANVTAIKAAIGESTFFCPMVKANAYGHGAQKVAVLCDELSASSIGVMHLNEAIEISRFVSTPIVIFDKLSESDLMEAIQRGYHVTLHSQQQIDFLRGLKQTIHCHLKFNTGMNRLGMSINEAEEASKKLAGPFKLEGVFTHLHSGEDLLLMKEQVERFQKVISFFPNSTKHVFNSPGLICALHSDFEPDFGLGCRIGGALYGLNPSLGNIVLRPVMRLKSQVIHIQQLEMGETVSYNGAWRAPRASRVAIVPIGYGDGFLREFSNRGYVAINGVEAPIIGNVCMDFLMVDVTEKTGIKEGSEVILLGDEVSPIRLAKEIKTTPYQLTTMLNSRVRKVYQESK